ncbi:hypothetical protein BDV3_003177 [Batrachochytrium dendrobatidis]
MPPKIIRAPSAAATDNSKQSKSSKSKVSKESDSKNADSAPPMTAKQQLYGTSWTGKTPLNLLHEHCQKQGWKKPILQCRKDSSSGSWIGSVKLAKMDKKTSQIREIYWKTSEKYESEQEARHAAATFGLHRVCHNTSAYRLLPPTQRDLWLKFEGIRKSCSGPQAELDYATDPFLAQEIKEREMQKTAQVRERIAAEKEKSKLAGPWIHYPSIKISQSDIHAIEDLLRINFSKLQKMLQDNLANNTIEDSHKQTSTDTKELQSGSTNASKAKLIKSFVLRGFRETHVIEAAQICNTSHSIMEWLCAHVPDDDFPSQLGRTDASTVSLAKHTTQSLAKEYSIQRLVGWGFPRHMCALQLDQCEGNEHLALTRMCMQLLDTDQASIFDLEVDASDCKETFMEEMDVLRSIFDNQIEINTTDEGVMISVDIRPEVLNGIESKLVVCIHSESNYPYESPAIVIQAQLPSYIRLSMTQKLMSEAIKLLGTPVIYAVIAIFEECAADIIKNPPSLTQLSIFKDLGKPTDDTSTFLNEDNTSTADTLVDSTVLSVNPKSKTSQSSAKHQRGRNRSKQSLTKNGRLSDEELRERLSKKQVDSAFLHMQSIRRKLPSANYKDQICKALSSSNALVLCGETGCGKSTQVGQFILEDCIDKGIAYKCNIICTQPRKLSAIALSKRVADERCETVGDMVGYAVRGDTSRSDNTRLMFCTTGILLRMLLGDPTLTGISHVIVDEVHERSVESDFLLILLRDLLQKKSSLRVILMSATINADTFSSYFLCSVMTIPGFTYPVTDLHLENILGMIDYIPDLPKQKSSSRKEASQIDLKSDQDGFDDMWSHHDLSDGIKNALAIAERNKLLRIDHKLIAATVSYICKNHDDGAILIFLPGVSDIKRCMDTLKQDVSLKNENLCIYPLHANLTNTEQSKIFRPTRRSERKIVIATNIAETSITIDDVVFVIDSGKVKEITLRNEVVTLSETWCSQAACKQRRGRAGRVKSGYCFKLFTSHFEKSRMNPFPEPEILQTPLEQLCLQIRAMNVQDITNFLFKAITPPPIEMVHRAIDFLKTINALDEHENLTNLGKHMSAIPADVRLSKMLLFGAIFQCVGPILTIAACLSEKSPFIFPSDSQDQSEATKIRKQFSDGESDLLTACKVFDEWVQLPTSQRRDFCSKNYLSHTNLENIADRRLQFRDILVDIGYLEFKEYNVSSTVADPNIVKAVIVAGLYPNIARIRFPEKQYEQIAHGTVAIDSRARDIHYFTKDDGRVFIHPSSINFETTKYQYGHLAFNRKLATSKIFILDPTPASPISILMFGGAIDTLHDGHAIAVGEVARFRAFPRATALIHGLRRLLDILLAEKFEDPMKDVMASDVGKCLMRVLGTA